MKCYFSRNLYLAKTLYPLLSFQLNYEKKDKKSTFKDYQTIYTAITIFINMTVSSWADDCQCSGGACCLHLHGRGMRTEVARFSKMPVKIIGS
jgi:hypothetical protein